MYNVMKSIHEMLGATEEISVNLNEINQLAQGLVEKGITFTTKRLLGGMQIVVNDDNDNYLWDAICHCGSYGHEEGLIEIMGTIVQNDCDDVEGYLTAEEILSRLDER